MDLGEHGLVYPIVLGNKGDWSYLAPRRHLANNSISSKCARCRPRTWFVPTGVPPRGKGTRDPSTYMARESATFVFADEGWIGRT